MNHRKIYAVTSGARSLGCTFLDWSILWLSGQEKIFDSHSMTWQDICPDPIEQGPVQNAHKHLKNLVSGWTRSKILVGKINQVHGLVSFYPIPLHFDDCCQHLSIDVRDVEHTTAQQNIQRYQKQDYTEMLDWLVSHHNIPLIYVAFDPAVIGYSWVPRSLDRMLMSSQKPKDVGELAQEHQDIFFRSSQTRWNELGLANRWDQRERMALDTRPFKSSWSDDLYLSHPHLWINCQDLWFNTEKTCQRIMSWLDLDISQSRLDHWLPIMRRWQQIHNDNLKFRRQLDKIIWSILHGHRHDLTDLTFEQEVIIQHCLIYQHNMNLKTWNLDKFPNCASDLHRLLETNFHVLSDT